MAYLIKIMQFSRWEKKIQQIIILIIFLLLSSYMLYLYQFVYLENFSAIIPGVLYRSGQPDKNDISLWHKKYGIENIINLRGEHTRGKIKNIIANIENSGVKVNSLRMSSKRRPTAQELNQLVDYLINVDKPLLIHCRGGVDRTGFASVIALLLNDYQVAMAMREMNWYRGFFPYRKQQVLKSVIIDYQGWLDQNKMVSTRANFIYWARNLYS